MKTSILLSFLIIAQTISGQNLLTKRLDSLTHVYESNNYHGVILVAKGKEILYEKGYGYANFEKQIRQNPQTVFKTESVGKMFTATSILQLVEQGKLKTNQTIRDVLPDLNIKNADKITIHQLLTHTSGLQSPWDYPGWDFKKIYSKAELVDIFKSVPTAFDHPGEKFYYSNIGYIILSWMIEKVSGLTFDTYLAENIFRQSGMKFTRHLMDTVMPTKGGAQPYRILNSKKYISFVYAISPKASGAGGWISTAGDLYRFMLGLDENKLINASSFRKMQTADDNNPKDSSYKFYSYGMETYINQVIPGENIYGHNGGGAGFSIDALLDPENDYIVVSCTNIYQNSRPIAFNYMKIALGRAADSVKQPVAIRLYDMIDSTGIDGFILRHKENFKLLNLEPNVRLFANTAEAIEAAGDYKSWVKWMELARQYFPEDGYILMISGDSQARLGNKLEAKKFYQSAKELATKNKDTQIIQAAEEKIRGL